MERVLGQKRHQKEARKKRQYRQLHEQSAELISLWLITK